MIASLPPTPTTEDTMSCLPSTMGCCPRTFCFRGGWKIPYPINHWWLGCHLWALSLVLRLGNCKACRPLGYSPIGSIYQEKEKLPESGVSTTNSQGMDPWLFGMRLDLVKWFSYHWFFFFSLFIWWIMLIFVFLMLNYPCLCGINPTWYMLSFSFSFFTNCWICFANVLLRILHLASFLFFHCCTWPSSSCGKHGLHSSCRTQASHYGVFFYC